MFELIFLMATIAGLLYAIYSVYLGDKSDISEVGVEMAAPEVKDTKTLEVTPAAPNVAVTQKSTPQAATSDAPAASAIDPPKNPVAVLNLRNPKTGEKAPFPNTYRFAKKWVKEIMVAEGLLDRVYTTPELENAKINQKVKAAIERLKTMEKYLA